MNVRPFPVCEVSLWLNTHQFFQQSSHQLHPKGKVEGLLNYNLSILCTDVDKIIGTIPLQEETLTMVTEIT